MQSDVYRKVDAVRNRCDFGKDEFPLLECHVFAHPNAAVGKHEIEMQTAIESPGLCAADTEMKTRESFVEQYIGRHKIRDAVVGANSDFGNFIAVGPGQKFPKQISRQPVPAIGIHDFPL